MLTPDGVIELLVKADDFCEEFGTEISKYWLHADNYKVRDRKSSLADREIITIPIAFHTGYLTNLKHLNLANISK
jgi:hypothetical protein